MSGGIFGKYLISLFKTRFGVFLPVTHLFVSVCVFLIIKRKFLVAEENLGLHKKELLKYHESF